MSWRVCSKGRREKVRVKGGGVGRGAAGRGLVLPGISLIIHAVRALGYVKLALHSLAYAVHTLIEYTKHA